MRKVKLNIAPDKYQLKKYRVVVKGEGFYADAGKKVGARLKGSDLLFDDSLGSLAFGSETEVGQDGSFSISDSLYGSQLNEDWGEDEIYAVAKIGGTDYKSNSVTGNY